MLLFSGGSFLLFSLSCRMHKIKQGVASLINGFSKGSINLLVVLVIMYVLINIFTMNRHAVEMYYSRFIFKYISAALNFVSSLLPISLAEVILFLFAVFISISIIFFIVGIKKASFHSQVLYFLGQSLYSFMCFALIIGISFMLLWGLNYYRQPLSSYLKSVDMNDQNVSKVVEILIEEANSLRNDIEVNYETYTIERFINSSKGMNAYFESVDDEFEFLNGYIFSPPKPILISKLFLQMQISGIYSPFTGEANVNYLIPSFTMTFTMLHEMAHQRGIAYEDEANFIAYVANYKSDDKNMQYTAAFEALLYCLRALDRGEAYDDLVKKIDSRIIEDIKYLSSFWLSYDGHVSKTATAVNDLYLKSNSQKLGVKSYSKVVNLIVAYRLPENNTSSSNN